MRNAACYAGTAFIDTVSITKANVKVLEDGDKWLIYNRKKTGPTLSAEKRYCGTMQTNKEDSTVLPL